MKSDVLGARFGAYLAEEVLATGHVSEVVRASHVSIERPVLLKILKPSLDPNSSFARLLAREAAILAMFRHANIPRLLEFHRDDHSLWMALDFNDGFSLRQVIDTGVRVNPLAVIAIGIQLADALNHVHLRGVVHGDVQPSNVVVGRDGLVSLIDFGQASTDSDAKDGLPAQQLDASSEPYMSPEQILDHPLDARSDMFSFAILMYELLTGTHPFKSSEQGTIAAAIRHDAPVPIQKLTQDVPKALAQLITTCLNKAPSDRFPSMRAVRSALRVIGRTMVQVPKDQDPHGLARQTEIDLREVIVLALVQCRLLERPPSGPPHEHAADPIGPSPTPAPSLFPALRLTLTLFVVAAVGAAGIHWVFRNELAAQASVKRGPLRLAPKNPGFVRVLARPWAHVLVDGQQVETTPFFRPIALTPGTHYVTLRHPAAPDERRVVKLASGEFVSLDVTMHVRAPSPKASSSGVGQQVKAPDARQDGGKR